VSSNGYKPAKWEFIAAFYSTFVMPWLFNRDGFKFFLSFAVFCTFIGMLELVQARFSFKISDTYFFISLLGLFIINGYLFGEHFYYSYIVKNKGKISFFTLTIGALVWALTPYGQQALLDAGGWPSLPAIPVIHDLALSEYLVMSGAVLFIYFIIGSFLMADPKKSKPDEPLFRPQHATKGKILTTLLALILASLSYSYFAQPGEDIVLSLPSLALYYDLTLTEYIVSVVVVLFLYVLVVGGYCMEEQTSDGDETFFKPQHATKGKIFTVLILLILGSTSYNFFRETEADVVLERQTQIAEVELANGNYKKAGEAFGYAAASAGATGDLDEMEKLITALENAKKGGN